ncbi:MAG: pro-sigmaK processing inhibitor BofA family protein [archaeon]|nr:pro-sigmaK processing inhibitor BofA family protein [archaeon]
MAVVEGVLGIALSVVLAIIVIFIALKLGKQVVVLVINSILGLVALVLLNYLPFVNVEINLWSVIITALAGIPGVILLILLDLLGIAF